MKEELDKKDQVILKLTEQLFEFKHTHKNENTVSAISYSNNQKNKSKENIKLEIDTYFENLVVFSFSNMLKKLRKALRIANKYIKFSGSKNVEVAVLIYLCIKIKPFTLQTTSTALLNLYNRQIIKIDKALLKLEEDLQYDYKTDIEAIQITII
jgi:hypothetical protein